MTDITKFKNLQLTAKTEVLETSFSTDYNIFDTTCDIDMTFTKDILNSLELSKTKQMPIIVHVPNHFFPVLVELTKNEDDTYICNIKVNQRELQNATDNKLQEKIEAAIKREMVQAQNIQIKLTQDGEKLKYIPCENNNCLLTSYFSLYFSKQQPFDQNKYNVIKYMARNGNSTEFRKYTLLELAIKYIKTNHSANIIEAINNIYNTNNDKGEYDWFTNATELDKFFEQYNNKPKDEVIKSLQAQQQEMFEKAKNELQKYNDESNQLKQQELAEKQKEEETLTGGGLQKQPETQQQNGQVQEPEEPKAFSILDSEDVQELLDSYRISHNKYDINEAQVISIDDLLINNLKNKTRISESQEFCEIIIDDVKNHYWNKGTEKLSTVIQYVMKTSDNETIQKPDSKCFDGKFKCYKKGLLDKNPLAFKRIAKAFPGGIRFKLASNGQALSMVQTVAVITVLLKKEHKDNPNYVISYSDIMKYLNIKIADEKLQRDLKIIIAKEIEMNRILLEKTRLSCEMVINDNKGGQQIYQQNYDRKETSTPNSQQNGYNQNRNFKQQKLEQYQDAANAISPPENNLII